MAVTVQQLAELVGGVVLGNGDQVINAARILDEAQQGDVTFLDNPKLAPKLAESSACAALVPIDLPGIGKTLIRVADPLMAFVAVVQHLQGKKVPVSAGIDPQADVHASATFGAEPTVHRSVVVGANTSIGKRCQLHAGVVIGQNCRIGDDVVMYPHVVIYDDVVLGDRVTVHANSVIGADGFGYRFQKGRHVKVPQLGNVVVGNDVEIGANSTIDRATFGSTTIGEGTKIDNLVQVAHNCRIGKHNILAAQVGIAGSCNTGNYVLMGGQAGVSDHNNIGDGVQLGAKTGVFKDVPAGQRMFLYPAHTEREAGRIMACLKKLPAMRKDLLRVLKEMGIEETEALQPVRSAEAPAA